MEVRYISTNMGATPVAAYTCYGKGQEQAKYFCIHRSIARRRQWSLTHVPTGHALGTKFRTRHAAVLALNEVLLMARMFDEDFSGDMRGQDWWELRAKKWYAQVIETRGGR